MRLTLWNGREGSIPCVPRWCLEWRLGPEAGYVRHTAHTARRTLLRYFISQSSEGASEYLSCYMTMTLVFGNRIYSSGI